MCFNIFSRVKALETKVADLCDRLDRAQVDECKCDHSEDFLRIEHQFIDVMDHIEDLQNQTNETIDRINEIHGQLEELPTKAKDRFQELWKLMIELLRDPETANIFCEFLEIPEDKVFRFSDALEKFKEKFM